MMAKREHIVPLSPQALNILNVMKPINAHREDVYRAGIIKSNP